MVRERPRQDGPWVGQEGRDGGFVHALASAHLSEGVQGGAVGDDGIHVSTKRSALHTNEFHVLRTFALQAGHAFGHLVGVAQQTANRLVHRRDLSGLHANAPPTSTIERANVRASSSVVRKAARPHLTSSTRRSKPSRISWRQSMRRLSDLRDRRSHVTGGIEDAVGCNPFGLPTDEAGIGAHLIEAEARVEPRNGLTCRWCPRAPARGRPAWARPACSREARREDEAHLSPTLRWSACPRGPVTARRSRLRAMCLVSSAVSSAVRPLIWHAMSHAPTCSDATSPPSKPSMKRWIIGSSKAWPSRFHAMMSGTVG